MRTLLGLALATFGSLSRGRQMPSPQRAPEFPYTNTDAWVGFMCDGKNEWVYLGFSNTPNLNNTESGDGFSYYSTRLKWGEEIKNARFSQKWGSSYINFSDGRDALKRLINGRADTLLLEVDWYGNGVVYFRFSLEGAAAAIAKARASCKK